MAVSPKEDLEILLEAGNLLAAKLDLSELLTTIMKLAARIVDAETGSLFLVDERTQELYFHVALGLPPEVAKIRLKMGQGIVGVTAQEGKPQIVNDVSQDPRWSRKVDKDSGFVTRSILAVPVLLKGRLIGVVEAINKVEGIFTPRDVRIFEAFAAQAAVAIDNARLFASLSEEKAKLSTLFDEMTDAAVLCDGEGKVLLANGAARKFFPGGGGEGFSLEEAFAGLDVSPSLVSVLHAPGGTAAFEAVRKAPQLLVLSGTASRLEHAGISGSGPAGSACVLVFRDETEARREEGLKRSFLSLISHKLKTPLVSINGYGQLLEEEFQGKAGAEVHAMAAHTISEQGAKLSELVDRLLDFTVLEGLDSTESSPRLFAVEGFFSEVVTGMEPWLKAHSGEAQVEACAGLQAYGDPALLKEALRSLIENAVKFTPSAPKAVFLAAARTPEGEVELRVRDTGPGIPPEERDKIFQKFYQIDSSFTGQVEGWGLGLALVKAIAQKHGGTVRLESAPGSGSTFILALPRAPGAGA